ncbi:CDP-alcohol phosphatidyltransferase family protein [Sphingobacterium shayense]|uniref:CDP-alcohol phosphatidyltransferase family protein n=1 Tax=Sphingobacterium shayense TaxID=626343 RepID=UPI0015572D8C|nr:CDP-alcohol phosphatidyltransferase family protein [Sphingobacterium shayense]NQD71241.1 CDP-alcohol phosphatidyltransferase family protein [Sphingobacterium shayense]
MSQEINKKLFQDRKRTNILNVAEQKYISYLVPRIPSWISSDGLTAIGFFGSVIILASFLLAEYVARPFLLLGIIGFFIQWFGDSLDGRIAFYRDKSRKWYGFALDIIMDWVSTVMIGLGYVFYAPDDFKYSGFVLVALYGWAMIISQLRYKITDNYTIDAGLLGPTEIRVIIGAVLLLEVLVPSSINYSVIVICIALFFINLGDTKKLLQLGDERDIAEKKRKSENEING